VPTAWQADSDVSEKVEAHGMVAGDGMLVVEPGSQPGKKRCKFRSDWKTGKHLGRQDAALHDKQDTCATFLETL